MNSKHTNWRGFGIWRHVGNKLHRSSVGFTIIELMIATSVFATVLLVISVGLLQIGRTYYKGITAARTQETARSIVNDITQAIQFGGGDLVTLTPAGDGSRGLCVGGKRFSYILGRQLVEGTPGPDQSRHVLVLDDNGGMGTCSSGTAAQAVTASPAGRELLSTRMRLARLQVARITTTAGPSDLYRVIVRVTSGDGDILEDRLDANGNPGSDSVLDSCRTERAGTQFCAVSELSTVVQKRVR